MKNILILLPLFVISLYMKDCGSNDLTSGTDVGGQQGTKVGEVAHDFTGTDRYGNNVSLSDFKGAVILVDFSTMWCAPCREEAAAAEELYRSYERFGFSALTVLFENNEGKPPSPGDLASWADEFGITFPVLEDGDKISWELYNETGGLPLNMIIDRDFVIRYKEAGYHENAIKGIIEQLL